jgi:FMN phosphatase YigB (HAD superfamily)
MLHPITPHSTSWLGRSRRVTLTDVPANAIAFQSSDAWDVYAASAFGMRVVWCNRYNQRHERLPGEPDREIRALAELPALLQYG